MIFINFKKIGILSLLWLFLARPGFADSLFLKDGREIKGEIIQNDSNGVMIEYFVTPTIKDQKTFLLGEIIKIVAVSTDDKAFGALGARATPQTVLDTSFYDPLIDKKLPDFIKSYPYSRHITELREDLRSLNSERDRVNAGDRRINGAWITAAEIAAHPYQTGAMIVFSELKQSAQADYPIATLKAFELLEKNYPGSRIMPDALDLIPSQLNLVQEELNAVKQNYDILTKKRQAWIDASPGDQAKAIKAALDNEETVAKAAIANATKDGTKFFPIFPNSKDSLDQLQALLLTEKARVTALRALPMRESLSASRDAAKLLQVGNFKEAQAQLDISSSLWPANREIVTLKSKLEDAVKSPPAAIHSPSPTH